MHEMYLLMHTLINTWKYIKRITLLHMSHAFQYNQICFLSSTITWSQLAASCHSQGAYVIPSTSHPLYVLTTRQGRLVTWIRKNLSEGNFCRTLKLYCFSKLNTKVLTFFRMPFSKYSSVLWKMTVWVVANRAGCQALR